MALGHWNKFDWWNYFLNHSNHRADIPIDAVSFHWYPPAPSRLNVSTYETYFAHADYFFEDVEQIIQIRDALSPNTWLSLDETGVILPGEDKPDGEDLPIPPRIYWNAVSSLYVYVFGNLAKLGIEVCQPCFSLLRISSCRLLPHHNIQEIRECLIFQLQEVSCEVQPLKTIFFLSLFS